MDDVQQPDIAGEFVGQRLTAVTFVMDYVQFHFDDCDLTAFTLPCMQDSGRIWSPKTVGWRDSLCCRIGMAVCQFDLHSENELGITFEDGSRLTVSLKPADYTGPEAFTITVPNRPLIVG